VISDDEKDIIIISDDGDEDDEGEEVVNILQNMKIEDDSTFPSIPSSNLPFHLVPFLLMHILSVRIMLWCLMS
jgi:hypothetical protein